MKKLFVLALVFVGLNTANAQHELGVGLGSSHLLGDFGGGPGRGTIFLKDLDFPSTKYSGSVFYRYNFRKFFAVRGQFSYMTFSSNDLYSAESSRFNRGLNASSNLLSGSLHFEFNFVPLRPCSGKVGFTPFVSGGVGVLKSNGKVNNLNEDGFDVSELQYIEGNEDALALNLPFSFGLKLKTKRNLLLGLEGTYWMAYTDKIDSYVRQQNDHYLTVQVQVSYQFCKGNYLPTKKLKRQYYCPTYF
jgi:hypothetical protein